MPKAMIITVGAQIEQIKFCLNEKKPDYLVLLGTNTDQCGKSINELAKFCEIPLTNLRILREIKDDPDEIDKIIKQFQEGYNWLKQKKIDDDDIEVDPTGGRKWMSAGVTMIASFMGLKMVYVKEKKEPEIKPLRCPQCNTLVKEEKKSVCDNVVPLGNAYDRVGFLEELKADKLFNEYSFMPAIEIYDFLSKKISDPQKVETIKIKKCIAQTYFQWTQFKFEDAYNWLTSAIEKIEQFHILEKHLSSLKSQFEILKIMKKNDEKRNKQPKYSYFDLLKDDEFSKTTLLFLYCLQNLYAERQEYDKGAILLYRILEFISQYRLAKHNIKADEITDGTKTQYNEDFKKITKDIFGGAHEISDKVGLMEGWILLYCIKDELVKKDTPESLKGLRKNTEPRNLLWIEHKNKNVDEHEYMSFKKYVEMWLIKVLPNFQKDVKVFELIKF